MCLHNPLWKQSVVRGLLLIDLMDDVLNTPRKTNDFWEDFFWSYDETVAARLWLKVSLFAAFLKLVFISTQY